MKKVACYVGRWIGLALSVALLYWIWHSFDLSEVGRVVLQADYLLMAPVAVLIPLNFYLRALRWGLLFHDIRTPATGSLFTAMMIGYLGNNILPARAGEVVRVFLLGMKENVAKSTVLATIVVERVIDLLTALGLLAFILQLYPAPAWLVRGGWLLGGAGLAAVGFLICFHMMGTSLLDRMHRIFFFLPSNVWKLFESVSMGFLAGVSALRQPRRAGLFCLYSMAIWMLETLSVWLIATAFDLDISMGDALFVVLVVGLGVMIPSAPGNIGTYEVFTVKTLALVGITGAGALSFALVEHAIAFLGGTLLGGLCLILHVNQNGGLSLRGLKATLDPGVKEPSKSSPV